MPGANCAFPQCSTTRRAAFNGTAIFQITERKTDFYIEWRKKILNVLLKYRSIDTKFNQRIKHGKLFICERYFSSSDIELTSKIFFLIFFYLASYIII